MKKFVFFLLFLPFGLIAQQADSVSSDKLSKWYRNSYQPSSEKSTILLSEQKEKPNAPINQYKQGTGAFLYLPYSVPFFTYNQPQILRNTPYYNTAGYMNPAGAGTIGQFLVAGGINYVASKVVSKEKKKK